MHLVESVTISLSVRYPVVHMRKGRGMMQTVSRVLTDVNGAPKMY